MQYKDKIFLVFYVDIRNIDMVDYNTYIGDVNEGLVKAYDDSVETIVVPIRGESRVECINPVYIHDESKIEELEKLVNSAKELLKSNTHTNENNN